MRLSTKVMLGASVAIVLVNAAVLHLMAWHYRTELREGLTESARSYYKLIVITRAWVAENGGVFVRMHPGARPNPYLSSPVLVTATGDTLVWRNPAMVTRELSDLSRTMGQRVRLHLSSLDPVNPANAPDDFERRALIALRSGDHEGLSRFGEATRFETVEGTRYFRYFAPLYTEESCLSCHADRNERVGDVRGGISILIPTEKLAAAGSHGLLLAVLGGVVPSAAISLVLFLLMRRSVVRPLRRLEEAAAEIGKGNFDTEVLTDSQDEIGDVGRAMARMQEAIRRSLSRQVQTEKMFALGQLSTGIAHEIRNPLFAIRNDLDYLQRTRGDSEPEREVYREMEEGLQRIGATVNAVLGYARPHRPEYGRHTFREVLDRAMALLGKQLEKEGLEVEVRFDRGTPAVEMDVHQMEQVFVNLLTNAMHACAGRGGRITIAGRRRGEQVEVTVADDGPGIEPADLPRIFDPFYTRSPDGTGLGLTIVRRIVEQHHGTIEAAGEPGRGAVFTLRLPVRQPHLEPA